MRERPYIRKQRNPTEGQVIPAVSEILTSAKTFITDLIQQLNSGIALNSQYLCHIQSNLHAWSFTPNMHVPTAETFSLQLFARLEGPSH